MLAPTPPHGRLFPVFLVFKCVFIELGRQVCMCLFLRVCVFEAMCVHVWMLGSFLDWIILHLDIFGDRIAH